MDPKERTAAKKAPPNARVRLAARNLPSARQAARGRHQRADCSASRARGSGTSAPERTPLCGRPHRAARGRDRRLREGSSAVSEWSKESVWREDGRGFESGESLLPPETVRYGRRLCGSTDSVRRTAERSAGERPGGLRWDGESARPESGGPECGWRHLAAAGRGFSNGRQENGRAGVRRGGVRRAGVTARPHAHGRPEYARRSTTLLA